MRTKDTILLEQAYDSVRKRIINEALIREEEANNLIMGFNMLPGERKQQALEKLQDLVGMEVSLSRVTGHKQTSGYGRDDGSATKPGSGGSVAHTEFELESSEIAKGIIQDVKMSEGQKDYTLNGNLIISIDDKEYNMNQGKSIKVHFLGDSPAEVHRKAGQSFRSGVTSWTGGSALRPPGMRF